MEFILTMKENVFLCSIVNCAIIRDGRKYENYTDLVDHQMYTSEVIKYASPLQRGWLTKKAVPALCNSLQKKGFVNLSVCPEGELISLTIMAANFFTNYNKNF